MVKDLSKLQIIGWVGKDPTSSYTPNGKSVTNFNIATNREWVDEGGNKHKVTTWFHCTCWGNLAEISKYIKAGARLYLEGYLESDRETGGPRLYEKSDGTKAASFDVTVKDIIFLDRKGDNDNLEEPPTPGVENEEDDIPF